MRFSKTFITKEEFLNIIKHDFSKQQEDDFLNQEKYKNINQIPTKDIYTFICENKDLSDKGINLILNDNVKFFLRIHTHKGTWYDDNYTPYCGQNQIKCSGPRMIRTDYGNKCPECKNEIGLSSLRLTDSPLNFNKKQMDYFNKITMEMENTNFENSENKIGSHGYGINYPTEEDIQQNQAQQVWNTSEAIRLKMKNNKNMKIAIIHHNADMDGLMSGALAKLTFETIKKFIPEIEYDIIGYNYGKNPDEDIWLDSIKNHYDYYQFIDVTPPIEWLSLMSVRESIIHIFDHHKPVYEQINILNTPLHYYFDDNNCGVYIYCQELLSKDNWLNLLIKDNEIKQHIISELKTKIDTEFYFSLIQLVDQYDTWKWQNNENNICWNALYVNEFFLNFKTIEDFYNVCFCFDFNIRYILKHGESISNFKKYESLNKKHYIKVINGETVCIINDKASIYHINNVKDKIKLSLENEKLTHEFFDKKLDEYRFISCIIFYHDIDFGNDIPMINLSVRQIDENFDCNNFVKSFTENGGGHRGAAGCRIEMNKFLKLI